MPCAGRAVFAVQGERPILASALGKADSSTVTTRLRRAIDSGDYRIDPNAVAEAILRRARDRARAAHAARSAVLVSLEGTQPSAGGAQLEPPSFDDAA